MKIDFFFDTRKDIYLMSSEKVKACELCREQPPLVLCSECCKCYCDRCNKFIHSIDSMKEHKIEALHEGVNVNAMCPIHNDIPLKMFCVDEVKLCCAMCKAKNLHDDHIVVDLSEIDKDNETFSASEVKIHFEDVLKCDDELDRKIETTINNIKKESKETMVKIGQTFNEVHMKLREEEEKIKEELEDACKKSEEGLQENLNTLRGVREYSSLLNKVDNIIREKSSRLMELNLVSEMEKQRRTMENLHRMTMKDLKIGWDCDKRKLSFTRNLFNGVPIPRNAEFHLVLGKRFGISWDCDESRLNEGDRGSIKFVVEAKKAADEDEKGWKEVYSGTDKKCTVAGLKGDSEYNVRIKCIIGDLQGEWSDVTGIRTKEYTNKISSLILSQEMDEEIFEQNISDWCKTNNFNLLYRGSRDGFNANDFHNLCNSEGKTLTLIRNENGHIFGGFASISWESPSSCRYRQAPGSFIFTLTNMHGIQPTKFSLKDESDGNAIHHDKNWGPAFGSGYDFYVGVNKDSCSSSFPQSYNDTTGKGSSIFSSNTSSGSFKTQEIEVFSIS